MPPMSSKKVSDNFLISGASYLPKFLGSVLGVYLLAMLTYSAGRIFFDFELNYNEGWNAYHALHTALEPIRNLRPLNYPPLSFSLLGLISKMGIDVIKAGRLICFGSFLTSTLFFLLVMRQMAVSKSGQIAGLFAALCLFLIQDPAANYIGINDPQFFSLTFLMAAFWIYVTFKESLVSWVLILSALAVGLSIKHNTLSVPLTILVVEIFIKKKSPLKALSAALGFSLTLLLLWRLSMGEFFFQNFFLPRQIALGQTVWKLTSFFSGFLSLLIIALGVSFASFRSQKLPALSIFLWISCGLGLFFSLGEGVSINVFFELFFAIGLMAGIFWDKLASWHQSRPHYALVIPCLCLALFSETMSRAYRINVLNQKGLWKTLEARAAEHEHHLVFFADKPGAKLCESLYLCFRLGEPLRIDPFLSRSLTENHAVTEEQAKEVFSKQKIQWVGLDSPIGEETPGMTRFSRSIRKAVQEEFSLQYHDQNLAIYRRL